MAEGVIDLLADNLEQGFQQGSANDSTDLFDDAILVVSENSSDDDDDDVNRAPVPRTHSVSNGPALNHTPHIATGGPLSDNPTKRFHLYVGNLTWWTSDQDITDAVHDIGVNDFLGLDVTFFEDRANGQSKGFCVISLASESIMRMCLEKLPKKELNGQCPVVTYPTMQAFNQFEAQSKTRASPPPQSNFNRPQQAVPSPLMNNTPRFIMLPYQQPQQMPLRSRLPAPGMLGGTRLQSGLYMPGPPHQMGQGIPLNAMRNYRPPPGFLQVPKPCMIPQAMSPLNQPLPPGMFRGPPDPSQAMHYDFCAPRPNWNPPTDPRVRNMSTSAQGPLPAQQLPPAQPPAPHVNPAFFEKLQHKNWHEVEQGYGSQLTSRQPHGGADKNREQQGLAIPEEEFEEIMSRNRTVCSSAIARAVADAATGEYASAVETLATAISLIKLSKIVTDDRCKVLINSLQVTLDGIETKNYRHKHRDRSRSRGREGFHKSPRREIADRSRSRGREGYRKSPRRDVTDRSRSHGREGYRKSPRRDRSRSSEYRERSRENDRNREREKGCRYYDDRQRERDRVVRERELERRRYRSQSSHRTSRR